jgi:hypothetical protein
MYDPFNFVISNEFDLLWYPSCKYTYIKVFAHIVIEQM